MKLNTLISLGVGGVGVATGTGVAISYYYGGESIREHIQNRSAKNRKFISLVPDAKASLIAKYSKAGNDNKKPKDVSQDQIIEWCEKSSNDKFSSEDDAVYSSIDTWCFVDITSLAEKAKSQDKINIEGEEWKTIWDAYKKEKGDNNLNIEDSTLKNLNENDRDKGAIDLYSWCNKTRNAREYEENSDATYKKYEKWCFKPK